MRSNISPKSKMLFRAVCIKRFCKENLWPVLNTLEIYEFYKDKGYLSVAAHQKDDPKNRRFFWINEKISFPSSPDFDEYFIKIEEPQEKS